MTIESAIRYLRPGAAWTLRGNAYSGLEWQDQVQIKPTAEEVADAMLLPEPVPVPSEVQTWALREVCRVRGHAAAIEAALSALPEPPQASARNRWEYKPTISRASSLITAMRGILGWSEDYVDDLFRSAAEL